ncbi:Oxidoreductase [Klebsiella pneumoniae subsp. rhinoscleromatis]|nr:Oxidoreductase [Klebsiella pneumoniae subsp. rhinoscleromatis]
MNATTQNQRYALQELEKEALMGAEGEETFAREVRCIDLSNFAARKNDIAEQLWEAAVEIGFFQVSHHGIPLADILQAFSMTEAFFDLPDEVKPQYPLAGNAGWESKAQVRPSTRTPGSKRVVSDNPASDGRALAQRSGVASIPADNARV